MKDHFVSPSLRQDIISSSRNEFSVSLCDLRARAIAPCLMCWSNVLTRTHLFIHTCRLKALIRWYWRIQIVYEWQPAHSRFFHYVKNYTKRVILCYGICLTELNLCKILHYQIGLNLLLLNLTPLTPTFKSLAKTSPRI